MILKAKWYKKWLATGADRNLNLNNGFTGMMLCSLFSLCLISTCNWYFDYVTVLSADSFLFPVLFSAVIFHQRYELLQLIQS
jgi:hypothetical protein